MKKNTAQTSRLVLIGMKKKIQILTIIIMAKKMCSEFPYMECGLATANGLITF